MELIPNRPGLACWIRSNGPGVAVLYPRAFRHLFTAPDARLPRGFNPGTRVSQLVRESRGCSRIVSRLRTQCVVRSRGAFPKPARLGQGLASAASAPARVASGPYSPRIYQVEQMPAGPIDDPSRESRTKLVIAPFALECSRLSAVRKFLFHECVESGGFPSIVWKGAGSEGVCNPAATRWRPRSRRRTA